MTEPASDEDVSIGPGSVMCFISIGNEDGKLSEEYWSRFKDHLALLLYNSFADEFLREYHNHSSSVYSCKVPKRYMNMLRDALSKLAKGYMQESIALNISEDTEFITP